MRASLLMIAKNLGVIIKVFHLSTFSLIHQIWIWFAQISSHLLNRTKYLWFLWRNLTCRCQITLVTATVTGLTMEEHLTGFDCKVFVVNQYNLKTWNFATPSLVSMQRTSFSGTQRRCSPRYVSRRCVSVGFKKKYWEVGGKKIYVVLANCF